MQGLELPLTIEAKIVQDNSPKALAEYICNNSKELDAILAKHGAILYRGFEISTINDFEYLVSNTMYNCTSYVGGDSPRTKLSKYVYTSTEYPAHQSIVLHNEMSFSNDYPRYLYFYCLISPAEGGETPLADNRELYKRLPKKLISKYSDKKLKYIMNLHDGYGIGKSWQDVFETESRSEVENILNTRGVVYSWKNDGSLTISEIVQPVIRHPKTKEWIFISQAHQWHPSNLDLEVYNTLIDMMPEMDFYHYVCYSDDEPLDTNDLELTKQIIDEIKIANPWQNADVLFIDNLLVMHGRNPFKGDRKILLSLVK